MKNYIEPSTGRKAKINKVNNTMYTICVVRANGNNEISTFFNSENECKDFLDKQGNFFIKAN